MNTPAQPVGYRLRQLHRQRFSDSLNPVSRHLPAPWSAGLLPIPRRPGDLRRYRPVGSQAVMNVAAQVSSRSIVPWPPGHDDLVVA